MLSRGLAATWLDSGPLRPVGGSVSSVRSWGDRMSAGSEPDPPQWPRLRVRLQVLRGRLLSWPIRRRLAACGPHLWVGRGAVLQGTERMWFGESIVIGRHCAVSCSPAGTLRLGDLVHLAQGCLVAVGDCELTIGPLTIIGEYTSIHNTNHGMGSDRPIRFQDQRCEPIRIGRDVWIGRGCAVLAGVTVGDGAVVGANSVVTRNVEPYTIVAGNPARLIRRRQ